MLREKFRELKREFTIRDWFYVTLFVALLVFIFFVVLIELQIKLEMDMWLLALKDCNVDFICENICKLINISSI